MERHEGEWFFPAVLLALTSYAAVELLRGERSGITTVVAVVALVMGGLTVIRREFGFSLGEDGPWQSICTGLPAVLAGTTLLAFGALILLT